MVNYQEDVEKEAKDFLAQHEDEFKEAIKEGKDFDYNDIDGLDEWVHEELTDRSYSVTDAAFVIDNSDNVETDRGLWEGQDMQEALQTQAAYTFSNDVFLRAREIFDEIKSDWEDQKLEGKEDEDFEQEEAREKTDDHTLNVLFDEAISTKLEPVETGSDDERQLIIKWLNLNKNAGMWGGYPVGSSYIDARCGSMQSTPEVYDYVQFDHELSQRVPALSGKRREEVQAYFDKTFGAERSIRDWIDTEPIAELLIENLKERDIEPTAEHAKKLWLAALEDLNEMIKNVPDSRIVEEAKA
jgi:hypothetical protein